MPSSKISIRKRDKFTYEVVSGDYIALIATRVEAKAQGTTPDQLAGLWASRLRAALATPAIAFSAPSVKIALDGKTTVKLEGFRAKAAKVSVDDGEIAAVAQTGMSLNLTGLKLGQTTIHAAVEGITKSMRISVLPLAAKFPQAITISVTGEPASAQMVRDAIEGAMWTQVETLGSASYEFHMPASITAVDFGKSATFAVPVSAKSPDSIAAKGMANVTVRNESLSYQAEAELWYCNHPENVERAGNLFAASLREGKSVRMLYHHLNASGSGLIVGVTAVNSGSKPARLLIIPGDSRPDKNPVLAGLVAGDQLLRSWVKFSGEVVTIPPNSSLPISLRRLAPQETMSGLCYLRLLDGSESLTVRTDATPSAQPAGRLAAALDMGAPWQRLGVQSIDAALGPPILSPHVYPWPFKSEAVDFTVGGRHGFVRIGQQPISASNGGALDGNFGVFYTIEANCTNPLPDAMDVEVVFEASAGYSGAIFVVNGEVKRTPLLQAKEEVLVARFKLGAGEKRRFAMMTVPLSGSSYPATIVVRPVGSGSSPFPIRKMADDDYLRSRPAGIAGLSSRG